jgi:hypothetical protein
MINQGKSPTPRHVKLIITGLRLYVSGHPASFAQALRIDEAVNRKSSLDGIKRGQHVFLDGKKSRVQNVCLTAGYSELLLTHTQVLTWCKAMESVIKDLSEVEPVPNPCSYCGYAATIADRRDTYKRGTTGLGQIAILVQIVCRLLFDSGVYRFNFLPICFLATSDEPSVAEKMFTSVLARRPRTADSTWREQARYPTLPCKQRQ